MQRTSVLLVLLILFITLPAHAKRIPETEVAGDLFRLCNASDDGSKAVCIGYIGGVMEVAANNSIDGISSCLPHLEDISKIRELTMKWIAAHPTRKYK
jgi:Rap1a immunity proteins